ncbi:hypothetical protein D3C87_1082930 [compost metagenome]
MVALLVFLGHGAQAQAVLEFRHRDHAVQQPRAIVALHGPLATCLIGLELAGNGLDQVLQRDQTQHLAVFVDHEGDLAAGRTEILEQLHAGDALRHEHGRLEHRRQLGTLATQAAGQQLTRADHAQNVVHPPPDHGKARVVRFLDPAQVLFLGKANVQIDHIAARHHQRGQLAIIEPEHVAHHRVLVTLDDTGLRAFHKQRVDLFFGHGRAAIRLDAEQPQHQARGAAQQLDERRGCRGKERDRACHRARDGLRRQLAEPLGHQFAQDNREIGQSGHHDGRGGIAGRRLRQAQACEPFAERRRQRGFPDHAVQHADGGNADLDGGQEPRGVLSELDGLYRATVAVFNLPLQPGLAGRDERDFGHGEQAVKQNERQ